MPSLFKRANGVYYFVFEDNGKRRWKSRGVTQKNLALRFLLNFDHSKPALPPKLLLSHFCRDFFTSAVPNHSPKTVVIYRQSLTNFQSITGDIPITTITSKHIDEFKTERLKTVSAISLNVELRTLRLAFNTAMKWRALAANPFKNVPLLRVPEQQPLFLTKQGFQKLILAIPEGCFRDFVIVAVFTGLKRGELLNLSWSDIDFDRKLIFVQSKKDFRTKAGKRRTVPVNETVFRILRSRQQNAKQELVFTINGGGSWRVM